MARSVSLSVLVLLLSSAASMLHPAVATMAATLVSIFLAWSCGSVYSIGTSARRLLIACGVGPLDAMVGKTLSSLVVWLLHMAVMSPVLALSAVLSGLRPDALAACALSWLLSFYLSFAISLIVCIGFPRSNGLAGIFLIALWLGISAYFAPLRKANPFAQVLGFLRGNAGAETWMWLAVFAVLGTALLLGAALFLGRIRRIVNA